MKVNTSIAQRLGRITPSGRFDFQSHRDFKNCYVDLIRSSEVDEIEIDFDAVEYLDSSALGMLLLFQERAQAARKQIRFVNVRGVVKQVEVANFNKLFTLS
ncbi:MAG: STAS domain-containing protein [Burkholderiales bacterium]